MYDVNLTVTNADGSDIEVKTDYITVVDPSATMAITATAGAGGTISPAGTVSIPAAGSQTFAITPNTGYHVADVLVDGTPKGAISSYPVRERVRGPHDRRVVRHQYVHDHTDEPRSWKRVHHPVRLRLSTTVGTFYVHDESK